MVARARCRGSTHADARAKVIDGDWIFRQLALYELGGLAAFLRTAPADLVSGADRIREWVAAPMSGFRLISRDSQHRRVGGPGDRRATARGQHRLGGPGGAGRVCGRASRARVHGERLDVRVGTACRRRVGGARRCRSAGGLAGARDCRPPARRRPDESARFRVRDAHGCAQRDLAARPARRTPVGRCSTPAAVARALLDRVSAELSDTPPPCEPDAVELWPCVYAAVLDPFVLGGFDDALTSEDLPTLGRPCGAPAASGRDGLRGPPRPSPGA